MNKGFLFTPQELTCLANVVREKIDEFDICTLAADTTAEQSKFRKTRDELRAILARFEAERDPGTPPGGTYINGVRV